MNKYIILLCLAFAHIHACPADKDSPAAACASASSAAAASATASESTCASSEIDGRGWMNPASPGWSILEIYAELNKHRYPDPFKSEAVYKDLIRFPGVEAGITSGAAVTISEKTYAYIPLSADVSGALKALREDHSLKLDCRSSLMVAVYSHLEQRTGSRFSELLEFIPEHAKPSHAVGKVSRAISLLTLQGPLKGLIPLDGLFYNVWNKSARATMSDKALYVVGAKVSLQGPPQFELRHPGNHNHAMNMMCVGHAPKESSRPGEPLFCHFSPGEAAQPKFMEEIARDIVNAYIAPQTDAEIAFLMRNSIATEGTMAEAKKHHEETHAIMDTLSPKDQGAFAMKMCRVVAVHTPREDVIRRFDSPAAAAAAGCTPKRKGKGKKGKVVRRKKK